MSITRNRYQEGSIDRVPHAKGPDVWVYRWRELNDQGVRVQRRKTIGTVEEYPKKIDVQRKVEGLRSEINAGQANVGRTTFRELWGHFQKHELRSLVADRSATTIECYEENMKRQILPQWGDCFIDSIKAVKVEAWLSSLPFAPATKAKYRNQMSCLFSHAIRHELWDKLNPIATVRQSSKRQTIPDILTLEEMTALLGKLTQPIHRIAVLIAAVTGLRRSEIRGLKWQDVDFEKRWLRLERGVVRNDQTKLKTEGSRKGVPLSDDLCTAFEEWRKECHYPNDENWVIASPYALGKVPLWLDIVLRDYIKPAAVSVGITKTIGWHTFRRSLVSILAAKGEHVKVVQELLRHSNSAITLELYQQAETDAKRAAQNHINGLFVVPKAS